MAALDNEVAEERAATGKRVTRRALVRAFVLDAIARRTQARGEPGVSIQRAPRGAFDDVPDALYGAIDSRNLTGIGKDLARTIEMPRSMIESAPTLKELLEGAEKYDQYFDNVKDSDHPVETTYTPSEASRRRLGIRRK